MGRTDKQSVFVLGVIHFFVDFTCTALLTAAASRLSYWLVAASALLYNGCAFAFQLPIGALADGMKWKRGLAALGCLLIASGTLVFGGIAMSILIGLGNACFHVGGGREALERGRGTAGLVGRFVAPGAVGIFLGPRIGAWSLVIRVILPLCLAGLGIFLWRRKDDCGGEGIPAAALRHGSLAAVCGCMFLTVLLRSYMGTILTYPVLSNAAAAFCYTLCIFGGKYFGGILADRFGRVRSAAVTQGIGTLLLALSPAVPALAFPAIFLFNTTMAVTAAGLYCCVPQLPGVMFGLTTFALYLGVLPRLLGFRGMPCSWWSLGLLSLLSAVLLVGGLILMRGGSRCGRSDSAVAAEIPGRDIAL